MNYIGVSFVPGRQTSLKIFRLRTEVYSAWKFISTHFTRLHGAMLRHENQVFFVPLWLNSPPRTKTASLVGFLDYTA